MKVWSVHSWFQNAFGILLPHLTTTSPDAHYTSDAYQKAAEAGIGDSDSDSSDESSDEEGTKKKQDEEEDPWDVCRPDSLKGIRQKKKGKAARLEKVHAGRPDRKEMLKKKQRGGGSPDVIQKLCFCRALA